MRYELMRPHQIKTAIAENWPVVLPLGVLEYHGEHLGIGLDTLVVVKTLELLEQEIKFIILPPFYYGAASHAVAGPAGTGTLNVDSSVLHPFARELFLGLLRTGFRNIHFVIHHQTENFAAGMPTDLAFKFAARQVIFEFLEQQRGEGWWGKADMADYYATQAQSSDPFNWIKAHSLMPREMTSQYPFDHAGAGETALLMALCPEAVEMERWAPGHWYTAGAKQASMALGIKGREMILEHLRRCFTS